MTIRHFDNCPNKDKPLDEQISIIVVRVDPGEVAYTCAACGAFVVEEDENVA